MAADKQCPQLQRSLQRLLNLAIMHQLQKVVIDPNVSVQWQWTYCLYLKQDLNVSPVLA